MRALAREPADRAVRNRHGRVPNGIPLRRDVPTLARCFRDAGYRTAVLFTSDHGCHFKTRNGEYKRSCHEASIRVPTLLVGPGFDGGGRVCELVSTVDLPPALLEAAGILVPASLHGRLVMPLLRGGAAPP